VKGFFPISPPNGLNLQGGPFALFKKFIAPRRFAVDAFFTSSNLFTFDCKNFSIFSFFKFALISAPIALIFTTKVGSASVLFLVTDID